MSNSVTHSKIFWSWFELIMLLSWSFILDIIVVKIFCFLLWFWWCENIRFSSLTLIMKRTFPSRTLMMWKHLFLISDLVELKTFIFYLKIWLKKLRFSKIVFLSFSKFTWVSHSKTFYRKWITKILVHVKS